MEKNRQYPVIDLFAGPGGLGEGFATCCDESGKPRFHGLVSIECDLFSHRTLLLRHFLRLFPSKEVPESYYDYLRGGIAIEDLYRQYNTQYHEASKSALQIALGKETHGYVQGIINKRLAGRKKWVLVGGPPCQAYSLVGRSRMMKSPDFENDERHFLYREYLKIIIDHQPPVFVMENVKGLLSPRHSENQKQSFQRGITGSVAQGCAYLPQGMAGGKQVRHGQIHAHLCRRSHQLQHWRSRHPERIQKTQETDRAATVAA